MAYPFCGYVLVRTVMTQAQTPNTFILFEIIKSEDQHGENLPVAVIVRLSESLKDRLISSGLDVEADFYRRMDLNIKPEDVRWLSLVAFDSEGQLAPVEAKVDGRTVDWYDPTRDQIIYAGDSANMSMEVGLADFGLACSVYNGESVPVSVLTLEKYQGQMLLGAGGETNSHWNLRTTCEKWESVTAVIDADHTAAPMASERQGA